MKGILLILTLAFTQMTWAQLKGPSEDQKCQLGASAFVDHENYFYYRFLNFTVSTPVLKQKGFACAAIKKDPYVQTIDFLIIGADDGSDDLWISKDNALRGHNILDNAQRAYPIIKKKVIVRIEAKEEPSVDGNSNRYNNDLIFLRNFVTGRKDDYRKANFTAYFDKEQNRARAIYKGNDVEGILVRIGFNLKFNKVTYYPVGKDPIKLSVKDLPQVKAP